MRRFEWSETEDSKEWDEFVVRNSGSIFHTWSWRRVIESKEEKPFYLACRGARGEVTAVCPFLYATAKEG